MSTNNNEGPSQQGGGRANEGQGDSSSGRNHQGKKGRNKGKGKQQKTQSSTSTFRGEVPEMNGRVFQVHSEQRKKGQFEETLRALELYASKNHKPDTEYLIPLFKRLEEPTVPKPQAAKDLAAQNVKVEEGEEPPARSDWDELVLKEEAKQYISERKRLRAMVISLYNIVWSQCSRLMQNQIRSYKDFEAVEKGADVTELLKMVKVISHAYESHILPYDAVSEARRKLINCKQGEQESLAEYLQSFKSLMDVNNHYGSDFLTDNKLVEMEKKKGVENSDTSVADKVYEENVRQKAVALEFLKGCRYPQVLKEIRDLYVKNIDTFPATLTDAFNQVDHYITLNNKGKAKPGNAKPGGGNKGSGKPTREQEGTDDAAQGIQHSQIGELVPGTDGRTIDHIVCRICKNRGHYADKCPSEAEDSGEQHHQYDNDNIEDDDHDGDDFVISFQYAQVGGQNDRGEQKRAVSPYGRNAILIDTGSTFSVFNNKKMLINVRKATRKLRGYTNGGHQDSEWKGTVPGLVDVWYNPRSMLNILSWSDVRKKYRITADTDKGPYIVVHTPGKELRFKEVDSGLYLLEGNNNNEVSAYSFLTLVAANKNLFTKSELEAADRARAFYVTTGMIGYGKFFGY